MTKTYRVKKIWNIGDEIKLDDNLAANLMAGGYLEEMGQEKDLYHILLEAKLNKAHAYNVVTLAKAHVKEAMEKAWEKPGLMSKADVFKAIEEC